MYTLSSRTLAALAFDRGTEYDPADPLSQDLLTGLDLAAQAEPILTDIGQFERRRRRDRERRHAHLSAPPWFSPQDLLCGPWELAHHEPV